VHTNELTTSSVIVLNCNTCLLCASFGAFVATFRKICTDGSLDTCAWCDFEAVVDNESDPPESIGRESNNSFPFENSIFFVVELLFALIARDIFSLSLSPSLKSHPHESPQE
jgi:hypothetical protein